MKIINNKTIKYKLVQPETEEEKEDIEKIIRDTCCSEDKEEKVDLTKLKKISPKKDSKD